MIFWAENWEWLNPQVKILRDLFTRDPIVLISPLKRPSFCGGRDLSFEGLIRKLVIF